MKNSENKPTSLEKEIRDEIHKGTGQKKLYDCLKNSEEDNNLANKISEYLPNKIKEKFKYLNYFIIIILFLNAILNINLLVILIIIFLFFYLKEGNAYVYRILPVFSFINIAYIFFITKTSNYTMVYIKILLWLFLSTLSLIYYKCTFTNKTMIGSIKRDNEDNFIFLD